MDNSRFKFRAWDRSLKKFWYWGFLPVSEGADIVFWQGPPTGTKGNMGRFKHSQSTGILDRHGKEMYEKDLVKEVDNENRIGIVEFEDGCFCWIVPSNQDADEWSTYLYTLYNPEIIGNIYENVDLLK